MRNTAGWEIVLKTEKLRQKFINIGYYATKSEALAALAAYNQDPYDLHVATITLKEVYEKWSEDKYKNISRPNITNTRQPGSCVNL